MLITIEGCVGAGKSTVAEGLARYRGSATLFEDFELNPFLARFYQDPAAHALETEFAFLLIHYHQLKCCFHDEKEIISDFSIAKDLLYADLNLDDPMAREAFQGVFELLLKEVAYPDVLLCLSASDELLQERIRKRNRPYEQLADPGYYVRLNAAFDAFFEAYEGRKLAINMDESDFVADPTLYSSLSRRIDSGLAG